MMPDITNAMFATCPNCKHTWRVIRLPQPVDIACKAMARATCPECGNTDGNLVATIDDIEKALHAASP